jgi:hypothetical protein
MQKLLDRRRLESMLLIVVPTALSVVRLRRWLRRIAFRL